MFRIRLWPADAAWVIPPLESGVKKEADQNVIKKRASG
jgi:hypothetical protein